MTYADLPTAVHVVRESYQAWYVLYPLVFADNLAWPVLAVGLYLSGRMGWPYCVALVLMWGHSSGVLKGSDLGLVIYALGLVVAMLPLGLRLLGDGAGLSRRARNWGIVVTVGMAGLYVYQLLTML